MYHCTYMKIVYLLRGIKFYYYSIAIEIIHAFIFGVLLLDNCLPNWSSEEKGILDTRDVQSRVSIISLADLL